MELYSDKMTQKRLSQVLKKHKLVGGKDVAANGNNHHFTMLVRSHDGEKYILKMRRAKGKEEKIRFYKEVEIWKILNKKKGWKMSPNYFKYEINQAPEFFIYSLLKGDTLGNYYRISKSKEYLFDGAEIVKFLVKVQKIHILSKYIKERGFNELVEYFDEFLPELKKKIGLRLVKDIRKKIYQNKALIENTPLVFCHGDFVPPNILGRDDQKNGVAFIDWSDALMSIPSFDVSLLWWCCWNSPPMQKKLYKEFVKKNNHFKKLFSVNALLVFPKYWQVLTDMEKAVKEWIDNSDYQTDYMKNEYKNIFKAQKTSLDKMMLLLEDIVN